MLDAAKTAEAVLITGQVPSVPGESSTPSAEEDDPSGQGEADRPSSPAPSSSTTAVDVSSLTAQTYLVRPTRPDANRNRGRNAFKRKPPQQKSNTATGANASQAGQASVAPSSAQAGQGNLPSGSARSNHDQKQAEVDDVVEALPEEDDLEEDMIEEMEHLQLSLEEAWFLSSALGVLKILDPETVCIPTTILRYLAQRD